MAAVGTEVGAVYHARGAANFTLHPAGAVPVDHVRHKAFVVFNGHEDTETVMTEAGSYVAGSAVDNLVRVDVRAISGFGAGTVLKTRTER